MSERFKITGSEINEVIFNSPYALADSPASLGQRASQTKRYFYQFINTLAEKINSHMSEIDTEICRCDEGINEAYERISELGESAAAALLEHNENEQAHADIRQKIIDEKNSHNQSKIAHEDIRRAIDLLAADIAVAMTLALGKNIAVSFGDEMELFEYALSSARVGDVLLLEDPELPDFTVLGVGVAQKDGDIPLDINDIAMGAELLPNKKYFIGGVRLLSSEGRLEASLLVKKDELNEQKNYFLEAIESLQGRIDNNEAEILKKETAMVKHTVTGESVLLESMNEYHLGTVSSLTVEVTGDELFEAILCFKTGSTDISFDAPEEMLFVGDDTIEGRFYPMPKRLYEISIKCVSGVLLARVGSVDYEVIM